MTPSPAGEGPGCARHVGRRVLAEVLNSDNHAAAYELVDQQWRPSDADVSDNHDGVGLFIALSNVYKALAPDLTFQPVEEREREADTRLEWVARGHHCGRVRGISPTRISIELGGELSLTRGADHSWRTSGGRWDVAGFVHQLGISAGEVGRLVAEAAMLGVILRVHESRAGVPVLLCPSMGLPGWLTWKRVIALLAPDRPVVTFQMLATRWAIEGVRPDIYTLADETRGLKTALDAAGLHGPFDVVGHSVGGTLALDLAMTYPELVRTLTLIEPGATWVLEATNQLTDAAAAFIRTRLASYEENVSPLAYAAILRDTFNETGYQPEASPNWPVLCAYRDNVRFRSAGFLHTADPSHLSMLRCPTLLIRGADSYQLYAEILRAIELLVPNVRVLVMPGGHVPHHGERAEAFVRHYVDFIEGTNA